VKVVYKYPLDMSERTTIEMPYDAQIVHVERQGRAYCLWAEHGTEPGTDKVSVMKKCTFGIFGTGHEIPDSAVHIGSIQDGPFVFHIYEVLS
jgi:hypothetical protein